MSDRLKEQLRDLGVKLILFVLLTDGFCYGKWGQLKDSFFLWGIFKFDVLPVRNFYVSFAF